MAEYLQMKGENMSDKPEITDAQQSLWDALALLWNQKSIYQIGIKELCQTAHVARSTFYVYYQNIDDLAAEMEKYHLDRINELNMVVVSARKDADSYDFYKKTYEYIENNSLIFQAWLIRFPNDRFIDTWKKEIKNHLTHRLDRGYPGANENLIMEVVSSIVVNVYTYWLKYPEEVNFGRLDEMIRLNFQLL